MHPRLERDEGDLPDHRVQHVLDLAGEHDPAPRRVGLGRQQRPEGQHLAEHRGGLGQGQRRVGHQRPLPRRQHLMHAVPQFVRQGHHVAQPPLVVQQQIGCALGTVGCAKAPGALPGRTGASIQRDAKNFSPTAASSGENAR